MESRRNALAVGGIALVFLAASIGNAAEERDSKSAPRPGDRPTWLASPRLLNDPAGLRSRLETSGLALQLFYNQFVGARARGGTDPDDGLGASGTYDLFAQFDLEELLSRPGLQVLLQVKGQYDRSINDEVGALSDPVDDADFDEALYVDQLWLQQSLWEDRATLRIGFLEHQNAFDRNAFANSEDRQFSASFLDSNPLVPLPNALGAVVWVRPLAGFELAFGVADADNKPRNAGFHTAFDGVASLTEILEATLRVGPPSGEGRLAGSYRFGVFRDGSNRPIFGSADPATGQAQTRRGHYGVYLNFDQRLFRERGEGNQGLGLFGRMGYADKDANRIEWFGSLGFHYGGPVPGRDRDVLGIGGYHARVSNAYSKARPGAFGPESGVEVYYRVAALPWLFLTPHFQYIASPSGERNVKNAVIALLRLRFSL